jgi:uncharacterized protein (TIGR02453 family)
VTFQGFGSPALPFFKALKFHLSKDWFEANRATYETAIRAPMGDLVEETAARLAKAKIPLKGDRKASLFRLHRDVRFSTNKDPYKTHAGLVMTRDGSKNDPGLIYFHLSPDGCFFAAGFHLPEPDELARLRAATVRAPKAFKQMTAKLAQAGLTLSAEGALKRAPRGYEDVVDPEIAQAVRLKSMVCERPVSDTLIRKRALVGELLSFASGSLPLLMWGWGALADSR